VGKKKLLTGKKRAYFQVIRIVSGRGEEEEREKKQLTIIRERKRGKGVKEEKKRALPLSFDSKEELMKRKEDLEGKSAGKGKRGGGQRKIEQRETHSPGELDRSGDKGA